MKGGRNRRRSEGVREEGGRDGWEKGGRERERGIEGREGGREGGRDGGRERKGREREWRFSELSN